MDMTIFTGPASTALAEAVAAQLGQRLGTCTVQRFPDSELHVELHDSVRGHDVYLIQATSPPVDLHLLELLFLADACRRAGAAQLTAVVPYFGYARQDRRARGREPVGARLVAELLGSSGLQRLVAVDLHTVALEGFFPIPLEHLSALPLLVEAVRPWVNDNTVIVAPDLGAVKLAERYALALQRPLAIVHKTRLSGADVRVERIVGEVQGRAPLIVDDMISTGGTIVAASQALHAAGSATPMTVAATHGLLVGPAIERLRGIALQRLLVTDSVTAPTERAFPLQVTSLDTLLAEAIRRLHGRHSLSDLLVHE
jgi:ribose-phosphate pyrophosphokinase